MKKLFGTRRKKSKIIKPIRKLSRSSGKIKKKERLVKEARKSDVKRRKSFTLSLFLIILLWVSLSTFIYLVDPEQFGAVQIFFVLVFATLTFTLSFAFNNTRRGVIATVCVVLFLILRYFDIGNILNLLLVIGLGISVEYYYLNY